MSDKPRPAWLCPVIYNEDRFDDRHTDDVVHSGDRAPASFDDLDERDASEVEELLRRPDRDDNSRNYECKDTTPLNYERGPHEEEFGVEEGDWDNVDPDPVDYESQPDTEQEFGTEDDD